MYGQEYHLPILPNPRLQGLLDAVSGSKGDQELANCVRRIAFLRTPHQGSDKARWAETARTFLKWFKSTNSELSKDLIEKSEKLAKLGVQFPTLLSSRAQTPDIRIDVVCFYEGLTTRLGGMDFDMVSDPSCTNFVTFLIRSRIRL